MAIKKSLLRPESDGALSDEEDLAILLDSLQERIMSEYESVKDVAYLALQNELCASTKKLEFTMGKRTSHAPACEADQSSHAQK